MGLGDFLDAIVESNPITSGIRGGVNYLAGKYNEQAQSSIETSQRGRAGGIGITAEPAFHQAQAIANNPANAPYRIVGEQTEQYAQNKIEAAQGYYKLGKTAVTHPTEIWRGAKQFAGAVKDDPSILGTIGKEVAIGMALDPTTYAGGGVVTGAHILEKTAAKAGKTAVTETVKRAPRIIRHSADELAAATAKAAREAAPEGLEAGIKATATRGGRMSTRSGRALEAIDTAPANLRETLTGNPVGRVGQKRIDIGEKLLPGTAESGPLAIPRTLLKDAIQSNPTLPTVGAGLPYRQAVWRAQQAGRRAALPGTVRTATRVGQVLNDPKRLLSDPGAQDWAMKGLNYAIEEHPAAVAAVGGAIAASQAYGAYNTIKGITGHFGGEEEEGAAEEPKTEPAPAPYEPDTVQSIGLAQFQLDNTRSTRVSRRQPGRAQLGTVTKNATMPTQIGPRDWYGPQGGYDAGRGFQQRTAQPSGALPPLEQPREVAGI